jgi:hypothetical protein
MQFHIFDLVSGSPIPVWIRIVSKHAHLKAPQDVAHQATNLAGTNNTGCFAT